MRERRSSWMHLGEGLLVLVAPPLGLCALPIRATASQDLSVSRCPESA